MRKFAVESLESRRLLCGDVAPQVALLEEAPAEVASITLEDRGVLTVKGTEGADTIEVCEVDSERGPVIQATVKDEAGNVLAEESFSADRVTSVKIDALGGDDYVENNTSLPSEIQGGSGYNVLHGGSATDVLVGGEGWDDLYGHGGDDVLSGGGDWDILEGGDGHDVLHGQEGPDDLYGGAGDDELFGGPGYNLLYGEDGNDLIQGGDDWDDLYGGAGNDTLKGGGDWDILEGEAGDDVLDGEAGPDELIGGEGADKFVWSIDVDPAAGVVHLDLDPIYDLLAEDQLAVKLNGELFPAAV